MSDLFDGDQYLFAPKFDAPGGLGLAQSLITAAPPNPPTRVQQALQRVKERRDALNQAYGGKLQAADTASEQRDSDTRVDHHWAALHDRLSAWLLLDPATQPKHARAQSVLDTVFPGGLGFLKLAFHKEWAEGEQRLNIIDQQNLLTEINELAGPEFLSALRTAHADYGNAVGVTARASPKPETPLVVQPIRDLATAIEAYQRQLLAHYDPANASELETLKAALEPVDSFKAKASKRTASTQPTPPIPPAPAPKA